MHIEHRSKLLLYMIKKCNGFDLAVCVNAAVYYSTWSGSVDDRSLERAADVVGGRFLGTNSGAFGFNSDVANAGPEIAGEEATGSGLVAGGGIIRSTTWGGTIGLGIAAGIGGGIIRSTGSGTVGLGMTAGTTMLVDGGGIIKLAGNAGTMASEIITVEGGAAAKDGGGPGGLTIMWLEAR